MIPAAPVEVDATEQLRSLVEAQAAELARLRRDFDRLRHDPVTGLQARIIWEDQVAAVLRRRPTNYMLAILDLDGFKEINDRCGHLAGDRVLWTVAQRLTRGALTGATVTRLGGDEFGVAAHTSVNWRLLLRCIAEPIALTEVGDSVTVTASLGAVRCGSLPGQPTLSDVLQAADSSMYQAKRHGTEFWCLP